MRKRTVKIVTWLADDAAEQVLAAGGEPDRAELTVRLWPAARWLARALRRDEKAADAWLESRTALEQALHAAAEVVRQVAAEMARQPAREAAALSAGEQQVFADLTRAGDLQAAAGDEQ